MCGIVGLIKREGEVDQDVFGKMINTLRQRGPDQVGHFFDFNIALGQRRLSVIDVSIAGRQPMWSQDQTSAVIFNGEIYNYIGLKSKLKGDHNWISKTDTEVLLNAYGEFGVDVVGHLEGMFAFGVYDKKARKIILARDHFGKKPLYYYLDQDYFCFASEIKAILEFPEIRKRVRIDSSSLTKYLFYGHVPAPNSIYDKIKKIKPATVCQFDIKNWRLSSNKTYWDLNGLTVNQSISKAEILTNLDLLLRKSVQKRLMSDVPLGVFLSGGVDSSVVAGYLREQHPGVQGFSVAYNRPSANNELDHAKGVANRLGIDHNICYLKDEDVSSSFLAMADYLDEPLADAATVPLHFLAKQAKRQITVALGGDGGDELFAGYIKYPVQNNLEKLKFLNWLWPLLVRLSPRGSQTEKMFVGAQHAFPVRQFLYGTGAILPTDVTRLLKTDLLDLDKIFSDATSAASQFSSSDLINKSTYLDCKIQLSDGLLVKADRATMAASLELRSPLLDKDLAEFVFSLPGNKKIYRGERKYPLKKIAEKFAARDSIYRKKLGFQVPLNEWIREDLKNLFTDYLFVDNGYFDVSFVEKTYDEHVTQFCDRTQMLMRIWSFNYFYENRFKNFG